MFFPVSGGAYNRVCGRVTAYQYSVTAAFYHYRFRRATTIDEAYVDGVSLTHGSPRQHIWTFAAGYSEATPISYGSCPCDASVNISIPLFVGGDYFCESGANSGRPRTRAFYSDDPLWDGKNCTNSSTCCSFNNPPYFTKRLSSATTDDIEMRLCNFNFYASHRSPIELLEIYTKLDVVDVEEVEHNIVSGVREEIKMIYNSLQEDHGHMNDHVCGDTGGWRRVVYMDMTDPYTNCPSGWQLTGHYKRTCGRVNKRGHSCDSVFFSVSGGAYSHVCGRIRGYQYDVTTAFEIDYEDTGRVVTIDEAYVTHGSPQQHIWTFAAGSAEYFHSFHDACPCDATVNITIPSFVGEDYFCESGTNSGTGNGFHPYDPLWDGKNCTSTSTCCSFNNPPYFTKQLPNPTTDDLELRLCQTYLGYVGTPIEFIELYVK